MVYCPGVVALGPVPTLVTVTDAPPEAATEGGLTAQVGAMIPGVTIVVDTWQPRVTVPVNPVPATTVMFAALAPPGSIAAGKGKGASFRVNCPDAKDGVARKAAKSPTRHIPVRVSNFILGFNVSDLNMSWFRFTSFDSWHTAKAAHLPGISTQNLNTTMWGQPPPASLP